MDPRATAAKPAAHPPRGGKRRAVRKRRLGFWRAIGRLFVLGMVLAALSAAWLFLTPSGTALRYRAADTLITTQHRHWAKYIIGEKGLRERVAAYAAKFEQMGEERDTHVIRPPAENGDANPGENVETKPLTQVEEVDGSGYHGYLLTVRDPKKIRLVVPAVKGRGEKVSSMVKRTGAVAGVNAGGFADPNWKGNGFQPIGIVISQGKIYYDGLGGSKSTQIVGIDRDGKMIAGRYTVQELLDMNVSEAVTFQPRLIVNGKGLIKSHKDGWGIAPRTVMGQKEDGSILFLVIDGRQPGYSIGADLYDCQQIMLEHGAVIAANLDGGSSTVLVEEGGKVVNKPASKHGERYLPTAFLVFDDPSSVDVPNIWEGLKPSDIDPSKW
ncbi:MAG: exopolysaccharide biosynthesis protein [Cohnella sp.]|jgi:exopolysaccharide biosynthesis protein|uniref:phosphodiester glycosidase family protein n=1 Tax=Cohnella sp. TaxID=1883426 RepID=UPI000E367137|nr:phosphodiester glycosidase family protein [Cohnella sp.]REK68282.1 MAG: exopolysaccharide biosynthesis protein [Cohnella sp.]